MGWMYKYFRKEAQYCLFSWASSAKWEGHLNQVDDKICITFLGHAIWFGVVSVSYSNAEILYDQCWLFTNYYNNFKLRRQKALKIP